MRRSSTPVALTALGLGVFLLVLAPLLAWYVTPQAKRTPTDINQTTLFKASDGEYFDAEAAELRTNQELTITRRVLGDVSDSEDSGRAVWDVSTTIDTPQTLLKKDPRQSLQWTIERWVTDRESNQPVNCCGADTGVDGVEFAGDAYLRFPFDVEETTYLWWDNTLQDTVPVTCKGEREIQGYSGLVCTGSVPDPVKTGTRQVPGVLVDMPERPQVFADEYYSNKSLEFVVDKRTGRILYASTAPHKTLRQPGGNEDLVTLLRSDGGIAFTEDTQKKQVALAEDDNDQLVMISTVAPITAGALGLLLAALGAFLLTARRPDEPEEEEEREPDGVPRRPVTA